MTMDCPAGYICKMQSYPAVYDLIVNGAAILLIAGLLLAVVVVCVRWMK